MCGFNGSGPVGVRRTKLSLPRDAALALLMPYSLGHAVAPDSLIIRAQPAFEAPRPYELKCKYASKH